MNLSSLNIERPVLSSVFSIVIVVFGVIGFTYLGVREYPSVDPPDNFRSGKLSRSQCRRNGVTDHGTPGGKHQRYFRN
jgi:hypothetical protein